MRPNPLRKRSAGERAFDWCMLPHVIAFLLFLSSLFGVGPLFGWLLSDRKSLEMSGTEVTAASVDFSWMIWIPFGIGLLLAIYWIWALRGVLRSWSDPVVRILRFCSLVLLLSQFFGIVSLLCSPLTARMLKETEAVEDAGSR